MSRFEITDTPINGLKVITRKPMGDHRGFLSRIFCSEELQQAGWTRPIAQINHTYTQRKGTVRGLHFQYPPYAEMKLVSCLQGEIFDVAVDVRRDSPTFLQWHAEVLSAENNKALLVPEGFAHGFQALTDDAVILYCVNNFYTNHAEGGLYPVDGRLNISWPLPISELSQRDSQHGVLTPSFKGI